MNPFMVGIAMQGVGGLLGGRARKKAANQARRDAFDTGDDIVRASKEDQTRAIEYRNADQAAMDARGAVGIDFAKLRDDAMKAGFNPLTALSATGGAGYDRPGILTTPFVPVADAFANRASLVSGTGQAMIDSAGYFGDTLSGLGSGLISISENQAQRRHEMDMLNTELGWRAKKQVGGFSVATKQTLSPVRKEWDPFVDQGPRPLVNVWTPDGWYALTPGAADRLRVSNGQTIIGEDWEALAGDIVSEGVNVYMAGTGGVMGTGPIKRVGFDINNPPEPTGTPGGNPPPPQSGTWYGAFIGGGGLSDRR